MIKRLAVFFLALLSVYILLAFLNPFPKKNSPLGFRPKYGASYSFEQAGWYGLDARTNFEKLAMENFDWIRVPYFWDMDNIDDIKFAADVAKSQNKKLIVALGAKTPYYPEYHLPQDVAATIKFGDVIGATHPAARDIVAMDKRVVEELAQYESIAYWQVENEPFLGNVNNWKIDKSLLAAEVSAVRASDPLRRPIILNESGSSLFDRNTDVLLGFLKPGDVLGVSVYFKTQGTNLFSFLIAGHAVRVPWPSDLTWPVQSWAFLSPDYSTLRKKVESRGLHFWVLESQAEPYIRALDGAKRNEFGFKSTDIARATDFLAADRIESVGLWGAPFWYYREKLGDKSWTSNVDAVIR